MSSEEEELYVASSVQRSHIKYLQQCPLWVSNLALLIGIYLATIFEGVKIPHIP